MLGPRLGAQRTQNNGQKIHVFRNHRRMHSSPFSPQGSRPGARSRRRAAGQLARVSCPRLRFDDSSRSAWEPPFTMRKEGLRRLRRGGVAVEIQLIFSCS